MQAKAVHLVQVGPIDMAIIEVPPDTISGHIHIEDRPVQKEDSLLILGHPRGGPKCWSENRYGRRGLRRAPDRSDYFLETVDIDYDQRTP